LIKANLSQNGEVQDWRENDFKTVKHLTLQNMKNNRFPFEIKTIENDSFIIFQQVDYLKFKNININSLSPNFIKNWPSPFSKVKTNNHFLRYSCFHSRFLQP
jgi:hypothetical protein